MRGEGNWLAKDRQRETLRNTLAGSLPSTLYSRWNILCLLRKIINDFQQPSNVRRYETFLLALQSVRRALLTRLTGRGSKFKRTLLLGTVLNASGSLHRLTYLKKKKITDRHFDLSLFSVSIVHTFAPSVYRADRKAPSKPIAVARA